MLLNTPSSIPQVLRVWLKRMNADFPGFGDFLETFIIKDSPVAVNKIRHWHKQLNREGVSPHFHDPVSFCWATVETRQTSEARSIEKEMAEFVGERDPATTGAASVG